jgi:RNA polymerase sigma-70 factor (ECF subfamily)
LAERCSELSSLNWETVDERLKHAIGELPLPQRTVFLLCAVEGLRYRDIADIAGIPVGTVMSRLYKARQVLSARLAALSAEQGFGHRKKSGEDESVEGP